MRYKLILKEQVTSEESGEQFAKEIAVAIKQAADQAATQMQSRDAENNKVKESVVATAAGVALALPAILNIIDKVVRLFKSKETKKQPTVFAKASHWLHHKYTDAIAATVVNLIPGARKASPETKRKIAEVIMIIVTIKLAFISGAEALHALQSSHTGTAIFEAALTAVKTGEVGVFLTSQLGNILRVASTGGRVIAAI